MENLIIVIFFFNLITFLLNVYMMSELLSRISDCPRKTSDLSDWKFERLERKIDWLNEKGE